MSPPAEIALARSAAPAAISKRATIVVLGAHGYAVAQKGQNGFTCIVERGWMQPFGAPNFWNVKMLAPHLLQRGGGTDRARVHPQTNEDGPSGASKSQIQDLIVAAIAAKALPTPEPSSMAYMMSKSQYLNDDGKAWYPHVMIFTPMSDSANAGASWGADSSPLARRLRRAGQDAGAVDVLLSFPSRTGPMGRPAPLYSGT